MKTSFQKLVSIRWFWTSCMLVAYLAGLYVFFGESRWWIGALAIIASLLPLCAVRFDLSKRLATTSALALLLIFAIPLIASFRFLSITETFYIAGYSFVFVPAGILEFLPVGRVSRFPDAASWTIVIFYNAVLLLSLVTVAFLPRFSDTWKRRVFLGLAILLILALPGCAFVEEAIGF